MMIIEANATRNLSRIAYHAHFLRVGGPFDSHARLLTLARRTNRQPRPSSSSRENLIAWCIVPFDAMHRGPEERAEGF